MLEKDIKILLKNKKKRCQYYLERKRLPDYRNYSLKHKKYLSGLFKYPRTIRLVLRINAWSVKEILKFFYGFKDFTFEICLNFTLDFPPGYFISNYSPHLGFSFPVGRPPSFFCNRSFQSY